MPEKSQNEDIDEVSKLATIVDQRRQLMLARFEQLSQERGEVPLDGCWLRLDQVKCAYRRMRFRSYFVVMEVMLLFVSMLLSAGILLLAMIAVIGLGG